MNVCIVVVQSQWIVSMANWDDVRSRSCGCRSRIKRHVRLFSFVVVFFFYYLFLVISNSISLCGTGLRRCKFPAEKLHFYFAARRRINIYDGRNATVRPDAMRCVIVNDCCLYNFESAYVQCKFSVAFSTVCFACLSATMLNDAIGSMTFCQIFITLQDRKVF